MKKNRVSATHYDSQKYTFGENFVRYTSAQQRENNFLKMAEKLLSLFEKLNHRNYLHWEFKMRCMLQKEDCYSAIDKDCPTEETAKAAWMKANAKAFHLIALCIENSQLILIKAAKTAKEAWDNLKHYHQKGTLSDKVRLLRKLFKSELENSGNMEIHLLNLYETIDMLKEADVTFEENIMVFIILSSIGEEYDTLITSLEARDEKTLTLEVIRNKLLEQYEKMKSVASREGHVQALKSSSTPKKFSPKGGQRNKIKCYFCKNQGHVKKDCRKFKQWQATNGGSANFVNTALKVVSVNGSKNDWCVDSGASSHISNDKKLFKSFNTNTKEAIRVGSGHTLVSEGRGVIELITHVGDKSYKLNLQNVLYVPRFEGNLLSVKKLIERNELEVKFKSDSCTITRQGETIAKVDIINGLFMLRQVKEKVFKVTQECIHGWHRRLAHRNLDDIKKLQPAIKLKDCECTDDCIACIKGKMVRNQFPKQSTNPAKQRLDVVVSDVCGPMQTPSIGKSLYFVTFIDEFTRYSVVKFIKKKSDVFEKLQEFVEMCKNRFGIKPKIFRSDNGGEYVNSNVQNYLKSQGIQMQTTVAYSPQQNGISERKNRTLMEAARAMLEDSKLHQKYWAEAVNTANYIQNRLLGSVNIEKSPFELWFEEKPKLEDMHVFGEEAYVWVPEIKRKKLDNKAIKAIFCGYSEESKGYRVATKGDVIKVVRDIKFLKVKNECIHYELTDEEKKPLKEEPQDEKPLQRVEDSDDNPESDLDNSEYISAQDESAEIGDEAGSSTELSEDTLVDEERNAALPNVRRSTRSTKGTKPDYLTFYAAADEVTEPSSFDEAVQNIDKEKWMCAMKEELNAIKSNSTYELVDLPAGRKAIGSRWVYKIKRDVNGNIVRYKARLVAQGYAQKYGVDYDEVFAPTSRNTTLRVLLSVASERKMSVKHYDIDTAFLHGIIDEGLDIYMKQPPGFEISNKVCKLKKTIYGLKQAARNWNKVINETLVNAGYRQSEIDKCLYIKGKGENVTYILLYVDDLLVVSKNEKSITEIIDVVKSKYKIKDLGNISHFLGMEVKRDNDGNFMINQSSYISKIVEQAGLKDAKDSKFPLEVGYFKNPGGEILKDITEFRSIIGMLLYVAVNTRPDISASVSILSQKLSQPRKGDLGEAKRIIRYLKATKDMQLKLKSSGTQELMGFSDANWAEDRHDRKSNSGYVFMLFGGIISWACRKQSCIALSSTEAEYIALSEACQEVIWLKKLCGEFEINVSTSTKIFVDNQSAAKMSENQKFSNRTKHVDTKYHFIRELVGSNTIQLEYVCSEDNCADLLTKPLGPTRINYLRKLLKLGN